MPINLLSMRRNSAFYAGVLFALCLPALCIPMLAQPNRPTPLPGRPGQGQGWVELGNSNIDGQTDHDTIKVGQSAGMFRAIQLRISGGAIVFHRVTVNYGNGAKENIALRNTIPNGGQTRAIQLPGQRRIINSVDILYSKAHWATRPRVTLFGLP